MREAYWPTAGSHPGAGKHDIEHAAWYNKVEKVVASDSLKAESFPSVKMRNGDLKDKLR